MGSRLQLIRRGALDCLADELTKAGSDAVRIEPMPLRSAVNLRGAAADTSLITDVQRALGIELPLMPNRWHGDDRITANWLGPEEWLLMAPAGQAARIEHAIRDVRPMDPRLSVVDVSDSGSALTLSGSRVRDVLAKGCPLDMHARGFGRGDCAQTLLAKARVLVRCIDDTPRFELWVRNSFARYTARWLVDAAATL